MSYTVEQLLWAIQQGRVSVSKETAAALILSAAEQMQVAPMLVTARGISLSAAGAVVLGHSEPSDSLTCDAQLRSLLAHVLVHCGGEHPQLSRLVAEPPRGVAELAGELAAALIPFNRSASRRALTRLYRRVETAGAAPAAGAPLPAIDLAVQPKSERGSAAEQPQPCAHLEPSCVTPPSPRTTDRTPFWGSAEPPRLDAGTGVPRPAENSPAREPSGGPANPPAQPSAPARGDSSSNRAAQLLFGRFEARRSDLTRLVSEFEMETYPKAQHTAEALCRSFDEIAGQGLSTCTPLPPAVADAVIPS